MRVFFAITVFFALLVQTFSMGIIMADFYIHQEQIASELCENKDKPQLQCEGNCQLKKELEKENKNEIPQQLKEIAPFLGVRLFSFAPVRNQVHIAFAVPQNDNRTFGYSAAIFHPPA